ncbi:PDR/VanB family oxidoreductase, partial [Massilia sp. DD77]|uniref:PDR/VanB family oxidoreductase n=1 Tax=Massilia sp. DD77 TaxID=3109349 RepID=UPI002FFDC412
MSADTIEVRVAARSCEADGICSYELVRTDGQSLPPFEAGAHIDVHLGEQLVRQYSLCNAPHETHRYLIGVLRDAASRGGSQAMHERVREGTVLRISAPRNHFPLVEARRTLLLAGGIGVTPILAMAEALAARGAAFEMHYCTRSPSLAAFRERIGASGFAGQVHFHFDDDVASRLDAPTLLAQPDEGTHLYVCGPGGFIEHILSSARAQGWPEAQLHVEYFAGAVIDTTGDQAFDVKLASSGKVVSVPAGRTVIQVLAEQGVDIPYSCEEGVCGTCLTRVVDGVPDHRDMYLTDEERAANDQFTPCCSRAKSR